MAILRFQSGYRFLSNFYPATVHYDNVQYPTVEHAYQASKTMSPGERIRIRQAIDAKTAKYIGRRITLRSDWNKVRLPIMERLVREKFTNPTLRALLKNTGNQEIIEGNTWGDTFWGVCNGVGENHLGKILMKIREELR